LCPYKDKKTFQKKEIILPLMLLFTTKLFTFVPEWSPTLYRLAMICPDWWPLFLEIVFVFISMSGPSVYRVIIRGIAF